jgi:hypothetical protein
MRSSPSINALPMLVNNGSLADSTSTPLYSGEASQSPPALIDAFGYAYCSAFGCDHGKRKASLVCSRVCPEPVLAIDCSI